MSFAFIARIGVMPLNPFRADIFPVLSFDRMVLNDLNGLVWVRNGEMPGIQSLDRFTLNRQVIGITFRKIYRKTFQKNIRFLVEFLSTT
jgi:hypothetical protein